MKTKRARNWSLVTYDLTEYELLDFLKSDSHINHYAFIKHDKDLKDDGSIKETHYHILINFDTAFSQTAIISYFYKNLPYFEGNILAEPISDKYSVFRYLTHSDNPEKVQYDKEDILCDDESFWVSYNSDSQDDINNLIDDIIEGKSFREMAVKYGRDYIKNFRAYNEYASFVAYEENRKLKQALQEDKNES